MKKTLEFLCHVRYASIHTSKKAKRLCEIFENCILIKLNELTSENHKCHFVQKYRSETGNYHCEYILLEKNQF